VIRIKDIVRKNAATIIIGGHFRGKKLIVDTLLKGFLSFSYIKNMGKILNFKIV